MKLRLIKIRDALADSFWFLPAVMALLAVAAALGLVAVDHTIGAGWVKNIGFVWSGGPDGARGVLSVIAGSVMTVVSIVFSLTITALATTSSHYGPRVLRNFTSDRGVQVTLGTFIGTFVYCLLVLRTVRSVQESAFVPYLAVTIGIALALASLAVLIFFIHHIAQSIQTENLIATVGLDLRRAFVTLFPQEIGESHRPELSLAPDHWERGHEIFSRETGYVQRIDDEALLRFTTEHDLQIKLVRRPGDFVSHRGLLMSVRPAERVTEAIEDDLRACVSLGTRRTPHQDPRYSLQQLVEIAAHALSPGINEPFTALGCLDWIGSALGDVTARAMPTAQRCDGDGVLRVLARPVTFAQLAADAFDEIRIYGANNPDVLKGMLLAIRELAPGLRRASDRDVLVRHVRNIAADSVRIVNEEDRGQVAEHVEQTLRELNSARVAA
jgi:uncharacterized membrane protein